MKFKQVLLFNKLIMYSFYGIISQLICCTFLLAAAGTNAQPSASVKEIKVSVKFENDNLISVFNKIELETDLIFVFNKDDISKSKVRISHDYADGFVYDVLLDISEQSGLRFKQINKNISVLKIDGRKRKRSEEYLIEIVTNVEITGKVTDESGEGLPGASVVEKGTTNGTVTDNEGNYKLSVLEGSFITISYVGYVTQEITVSNQTTIDVLLIQDVSALSEVIVTALGIERDKDAIGYSVTEIKELEEAGVFNVATALSGKVAGVRVSQVASGTGGSSKVIIRGNNSLTGNSQPLYVIDGIPLSNDVFGQAGRWGGTDYGDGISNINQDDIESISILKGPNAASLYGQRGSNGVILITTKSGKSRKGIGVKFNSSFSVGDAAVLPDFQNEYGQGFNGEFTHLRATADGTIYSWEDAQNMGITGIPKMSAGRNRLTRGSWGAAYDGRLHEDQFGNELTYEAQPNTYQDFFEKEINWTNTLSLTGGNEKVNYYISFSNTSVDGYVPTNKINRNNFTIRTTADITSKLQVDVKMNYIVTEGTNRPTLSDGVDNPAYLLISQPRSMYASSLQEFTWTEEQLEKALGYGRRSIPGNEKTYATNGSTANQYWTINKQLNTDRKDRLLASLNLKYDVSDFISINLRGGTDMYTEQRIRHREIGSRRSPNQKGDISEIINRVREDYFDGLVTFKVDPIEDIKIQFNVGASHQKLFFRQVGFRGNEFQVPELFSVNNTLNQVAIFGLRESIINSVYGTAQVAFREYLFLDVTARNDWSSTLPLNDNSFFYPSVSASFVLSEALGISQNSILSYLKLRGSIAQAGSSGNPYQLLGAYSLASNTFGGSPVAGFSSVIPDPDLDNELTTSHEFGVEMSLFNNRFGIHFTYYSASTENQILSVPLPRSTNFSGIRINAGEITNKGIELLLTGTPIILDNGFVWESSFNFGRNVNEVVSLAEDVDVLVLGVDRNVNVVAIPGKPFGQIFGTSFSWQKDENNNILIDPATGLPITSSGKNSQLIGSALPDWTGGFSNTFSYKGFNLSALIDISQGGQIFSQSRRELIVYGSSKETLAGRDGTYIAEGVIAELNTEGDWVGTGVQNTIQVNAQDYWNVVASTKDNLVSEEMLNDASFISMREITLSYRLPSKLVSRTPFRNIGVGLFGRNLFYFQRNTDGYAPEASQFNVNNSSLGLESTSLPMLRTFGVNLNIEL